MLVLVLLFLLDLQEQVVVDRDVSIVVVHIWLNSVQLHEELPLLLLLPPQPPMPVVVVGSSAELVEVPITLLEIVDQPDQDQVLLLVDPLPDHQRSVSNVNLQLI